MLILHFKWSNLITSLLNVEILVLTSLNLILILLYLWFDIILCTKILCWHHLVSVKWQLNETKWYFISEQTLNEKSHIRIIENLTCLMLVHSSHPFLAWTEKISAREQKRKIYPLHSIEYSDFQSCPCLMISTAKKI